MRRVALAAASGLLLFAASPPRSWWPLAIAGFMPLLFAIRGAGPGRAFLLGWAAGLVYMAFAHRWFFILQHAFAAPAWLAALLTVLNAAWQGLVFALFAFGTALFSGRFRLSPLLAAPLCFAVAETVVPFALKGYLAFTVWNVWPLTQLAEVGGPPAVSALLVLANAVLLEAGWAVARGKLPGRAVRVGALAFLMLSAAGWARGSYVLSVRERAPVLTVGLVQPNAPIYPLLKEERGVVRFHAELAASTTVLLANGADLVVLPEVAWYGGMWRPQIGSAAPLLLEGAARGFPGKVMFGSLTYREDGRWYNSALLYSNERRIEGIYDKYGMMPFSEDLPGVLERIGPVRDFWRRETGRELESLRGPGPGVIESGPLRIGVLICYEETLPSFTIGLSRRNPNLIVGLGSDFTLGDWGAAFQHMMLTSFRAIEARRDVAHAAGHGVSAIFDAAGRPRVVGPNGALATEPISALSGSVALLEIPTIAPYAIPLFAPLCFASLAVAAASLRIAERRRIRAGAAARWPSAS